MDKQVDFHVIPHYYSICMLGDTIFEDKNWPKPPNVLNTLDLSPESFTYLKEKNLAQWK